MSRNTLPSQSRCIAWLVVAGCIVCARSNARGEPPVSNWLRFVPAEARLYVEFRDLLRIRAQLKRLGVWEAIQTLSDHAEASPAGEAWQDWSQQLLGMSREELVTTLLGVRTALIASDPLEWKKGLVLTEMRSERAAAGILKRWDAEPIGDVGSVQRYRLRKGGGLHVARRGRLLLFGPPRLSGRLWRRTVRLMAARRGASLADDRRLQRAAVSGEPRPDGLVIVSSVGSEGPRDTTGATRWLAWMHFEEQALTIDLRSTAASAGAAGGALRVNHELTEWLGQRAILLWCAAFDPSQWTEPSESTPGAFGSLGGMLRAASAIMDPRSAVHSELERLGPGVALAIHIEEASTAEGRFQAPVLTLAIEARKPAEAAERLTRLAGLFAAFVNTQLARSQAPDAPSVSIQEEEIDGNILRRLPLGAALATKTDCPFLAGLELAWVPTDQWLVVSTSSRMLQRLVHDEEAVARGAADSQRPAYEDAEQWLAIRGTAVADMLRSWMDYARKRDAGILRRRWWLDRARRLARARQTFGVTIRGDTERGTRAVVVEVEPGTPAAHVLQPGDVITGVEGELLMTSLPAREVAERFRTRELDESFELSVLRNGEHRRIRVSIPPVSDGGLAVINPVAAIRPIIVLGRRVSWLTVRMARDDDDRLIARVTLRWRGAARNPPGLK
ncbi:MAG: PDZ domain-containing protein [Phycisphaerae bacterium]